MYTFYANINVPYWSAIKMKTMSISLATSTSVGFCPALLIAYWSSCTQNCDSAIGSKNFYTDSIIRQGWLNHQKLKCLRKIVCSGGGGEERREGGKKAGQVLGADSSAQSFLYYWLHNKKGPLKMETPIIWNWKTHTARYRAAVVPVKLIKRLLDHID